MITILDGNFKSKGGSQEDIIHDALEDIRSGKCSFRKAELKYGVPKSTPHDCGSGRVEVGKRQRPPPILRKDEEQCLVNWAVEMNKIGYGQTRRQVCEMDGRPNPFKDNCPRKTFLACNGLTIRSSSSLEMYRALACTKQNLDKWYLQFEQFLSCHSLLNEPDRIWNCNEGISNVPKVRKNVTSSRNEGSVLHLLFPKRSDNYPGHNLCKWTHHSAHAHFPWETLFIQSDGGRR